MSRLKDWVRSVSADPLPLAKVVSCKEETEAERGSWLHVMACFFLWCY